MMPPEDGIRHLETTRIFPMQAHARSGRKPATFGGSVYRGVTEDIMRTTHSSGAPPLVEPTLGIWFDGRAYHYHQYSYDRLDDAIAYARADRGSPDFHDEPLPDHWEEWQKPTSEETAQMAAFGIVHENGFYRYGPFRYESLDDALNYARHAQGLSASTSKGS
jgi:hypothetical protein